MIQSPGRYRSGFTLLELLIVISISSAILVLATVVIHQTMKFSSRLKQHRESHLAMNRLANVLRDEVHRARSMEMQDGVLALTGSGEATADFEIQENVVVLTRRAKKKVISQEVFNLRRNVKIVWQTDEMPERIGLAVFRELRGVAKEYAVADERSMATRPVDLVVSAGVDRWKKGVPIQTTGEEAK